MNTVTISKREYLELKRTQEKMSAEFLALKAAVVELMNREDVAPSALKKLKKQSELLDRGGGKKFFRIRDFKKYISTL